ncbi:MAG: hypothetical protein V4568_18045 [Pseudomonadota bacterium]
MDIPTYIQGGDTTQENYQEELSQTLQQGVGNNGFIIPSVTNAQLTTNIVVAPDGTLTSLGALMPDGTIWFSQDAVPPCYVGKISGALVKFSTTVYP